MTIKKAIEHKNLSYLVLVVILCISCRTHLLVRYPLSKTRNTLSGSAFFDSVKSMSWKQREAVALPLLLAGDMPSFLLRFVPIHVSIVDSATHKNIKATYYVSADYVSIGNNDDWARLPLTPMAAQQLADTLHCFLPTKKMVDDIYKHSQIKLPPIPMYAFRDSGITMYQHHLIIEGQRKQKKGLIAGIKKDLVISSKLTSAKPDREAIYGWHQLNGKPIQPLYLGHINWWVDYSHGTRLAYRYIVVDGKKIDYIQVLQNPRFRKLLCDEDVCDFYRY